MFEPVPFVGNVKLPVVLAALLSLDAVGSVMLHSDDATACNSRDNLKNI